MPATRSTTSHDCSSGQSSLPPTCWSDTPTAAYSCRHHARARRRRRAAAPGRAATQGGPGVGGHAGRARGAVGGQRARRRDAQRALRAEPRGWPAPRRDPGRARCRNSRARPRRPARVRADLPGLERPLPQSARRRSALVGYRDGVHRGGGACRVVRRGTPARRRLATRSRSAAQPSPPRCDPGRAIAWLGHRVVRSILEPQQLLGAEDGRAGLRPGDAGHGQRLLWNGGLERWPPTRGRHAGGRGAGPFHGTAVGDSRPRLRWFRRS